MDGFKEVFASKGKAVMHVRYYGYADLDTFVKFNDAEILLNKGKVTTKIAKKLQKVVKK